MEVAFDTFWVDIGSTALRPTLSPGACTAPTAPSLPVSANIWCLSHPGPIKKHAANVGAALAWRTDGTRCCTPGEGSKTGMGGVVDSVVNALGRAAFLPQFAVFPVKYLDADMAVFTFPPLNSSLIAVRRVG